jgi:hypothetical protein
VEVGGVGCVVGAGIVSGAMGVIVVRYPRSFHSVEFLNLFHLIATRWDRSAWYELFRKKVQAISFNRARPRRRSGDVGRAHEDWGGAEDMAVDLRRVSNWFS